MEKPSLERLIGSTIVALIPMFNPKLFKEFRLHGVESGGVWVESQEAINQLLGAANVAVSPRTMIFFVPFHEIRFVLDSLDAPGLSEKAFGV
jgi:hypothetical protein